MVALLKVVLLGVAAAKNHIRVAIHVVEGAGVTRHVTSSGTVVKTFASLAAPVSLKSSSSNL